MKHLKLFSAKLLSTLAFCSVVLSSPELAAATESSCPSVPLLPGVTIYYRNDGKLAEIVAPKARVRFTYAGPLFDISHTEFKVRLEKPDKFGRHDVWGPARWSLYDAKSGELRTINQYPKKEKGQKGFYINLKTGRIDGWALQHQFPANFDFSKIQDTKSGELVYAADADYVTVSGDRSAAGQQQVTVTEPTNLHSAECYSFGGAAIPMQRPGTKPAGNRVYMKDGTGYYEVHDEEPQPQDPQPQNPYEEIDDDDAQGDDTQGVDAR